MLGEGENRPTAFVCYNDELAVLLMEAVAESGLQVPEDVSIIGFDDSSLATASGTKLTTLTHPKTEMGQAAASQLIAMIEQGNRRRDTIYEPELIVRDSVAKRN